MARRAHNPKGVDGMTREEGKTTTKTSSFYIAFFLEEIGNKSR
jgi:hypothetical protein